MIDEDTANGYIATARGEKDSAVDYEPSPEDAALIRKMNKMLTYYKEGRSKYDQKWPEFYGLFRGKQWKRQRPSYLHSEYINLVFQAIQSIIPIMSDSRPKVEFIPETPDEREFADIMNDICEFDWVDKNWLAVLTEGMVDNEIFGTAVGHLYYDAKADMGLGSAIFKTKEPLQFYPDPEAEDVVDCDGIIEAKPLTLKKIKQMWPVKGRFVSEGDCDFGTDNITEGLDMADLEYKSFQSRDDTLADSNKKEDKSYKKSLVVTVYWRCDEMVEDEEEVMDENGDVGMSLVTKKRYPNGRKTVFAGNVVLEDGPNENEVGAWPYMRMQCYISPRQFWGISEIEQIESPQKIFNKLVCFTLDYLTMMGNPVWVVDSTSLVDTGTITNKPGLIIEKQPNTEVRRIDGANLPPFVFQLIDRMKAWMDDIHGAHEVSRGVNPAGVTAASAIKELIDSSQTRIRQKMRNVDAFLQIHGQLYIEIVLRNYTVPKVYRITKNQNVQKYFKFYVNPDFESPKDRPALREVIFRNLELADDGVLKAGEEKRMQVEGRLKVRVSTGSTLPFSRVEKENELLKLFDRGIIDEEEVLKGTEYPNYQKVLERVQERQQKLQEMKQQPQQQGINDGP